MRNKIPFGSLLASLAALWSIAPQAQAAPTNAQLLDKILATAKPGAKLVRSGDMLLSVDALRAYRGKIGNGKQAASAFFRTNLWPEGKVAYTIDPSLQPKQRTLFVEAIRELETVAQLKFSPRTTETDYIRVFTDPTAIGFSYSAVGRVGGQQDLSLNNFGNRYTAVHEIMHALGLMHEQSRSDRDNFVTIDFTNIGADFQSQFAIVANSNNRGTYDFDSVMHYPAFAFATDPSKPTIIAKPAFSQFQNKMGQSDHISTLDKRGLAEVYGPPGDIVRAANDNFANAQLIEGSSGSVAGNNSATTHEVGEDNHAGSNAKSSIWYRWRPTAGGTVTFTTKGSAINTVLAVYLGLSVATVTEVTSNDDVNAGAAPPDLTSSVTFPAQANAVYYIAVDSSISNFFGTGDTGSIKLNWNQNVSASRFKLSGIVKTSASKPLGGVTISLSGADAGNKSTVATATTNASGAYTINNLLSGSYNLRASKIGYSFTPNPLKVKLSGASTTNNFIATEIPVSQLPEMFVSDVAVREGQAGDAFVTFNVSMSVKSKDPLTVNYATLDGTASSSSDYSSVRGTLTFAPGTLSLTLNVPIRPDTLLESDETFSLKLSGAAGARIVKETGVATLINDDAAAASSPVDSSARSSKIETPKRFARLSSTRN